MPTKHTVIFLLVFVLIGACDGFHQRTFVLRHNPNVQSPEDVVRTIGEYFQSVGFQVSEKRHTVYPLNEKRTRYWVGEGYKAFNFRRKGEAISIFLVNDKDIYLKWDEFGPLFGPSPEYFDKFISAIKKELNTRLGVDVSIELVHDGL